MLFSSLMKILTNNRANVKKFCFDLDGVNCPLLQPLLEYPTSLKLLSGMVFSESSSWVSESVEEHCSFV